MAIFTILSGADNYYQVKIEFGDQVFTQQLTSDKTGAALTAQFQSYADLMETDWNAMQPEPEGE